MWRDKASLQPTEPLVVEERVETAHPHVRVALKVRARVEPSSGISTFRRPWSR